MNNFFLYSILVHGLFLIGTPLSLFSLDLDTCIDNDNGQNSLLHDLMIVDYWNRRLEQHLPVTYNYLLQGGYFNMPSARMGNEGEIGFGYSSVPPYRNYNLRFQIIDRLEISGNYRIFKGIEDKILGPDFGDFSDKGVNIKFSLFSPEDSQYRLPGVALGLEDILGTRAFKSRYIVFTQVLLNYNLELSLGYGGERIRGCFGGLCWMPFRQCSSEYLQGLALVAEYDATPYKDPEIEKHPKGRVKKTPWNIGIKYRVWDNIDLSLSYVRGDALAFSASTFYNFGYSKGFLPKLEDPLPYKAPVNTEPLGCLRPEDAMVHDFGYAMRDQGFELIEAWLSYECEQTVLRLKVFNCLYREERYLRDRLNALIAALTPTNIDQVIVILEAEEIAVQEYRYNMEFVRHYQSQDMGRYELAILTPLCEVSPVPQYQSTLLFKKNKEHFNVELLPKTYTLFGSSKGKFKYALGLSVNINGFLTNDIFYSVSLGYFFASSLYDLRDTDRLNPSQIINVNTDIINYYKQKSITVDEAFVQKISNFGNGWYTRYTIGLFDCVYGGVGTELLYYPINSLWAFGVEAAIVKKRHVEGIGFTDKIRKLDGFTPTYRKFTGTQYFLNLYYDWKAISLEFKISTGKFLANDYGARFEICRYFPSGLRLCFWYTHTNGHDSVNGHTYYDKGVAFSVPLDIFYTKSSRSRWGYGMSAWLRDVGFRTYTGTEIYYLINEQRQ